jgi:hypothetical protein
MKQDARGEIQHHFLLRASVTFDLKAKSALTHILNSEINQTQNYEPPTFNNGYHR